MKKNAKYIIAGAVILLTLIWVMDAFRASLTRYVSIRAAMESRGKVQVAGVIVAGSALFDGASSRFSFDIRDDSGPMMKIMYRGAKPGNFDDADKVVATGIYDPKRALFDCEELLVKCPTKYEGRIEGK